MDTLTIRMELDQLNADRAVLVHRAAAGSPSLGSLTLRRSTWDDLGRPGYLELPLAVQLNLGSLRAEPAA